MAVGLGLSACALLLGCAPILPVFSRIFWSAFLLVGECFFLTSGFAGTIIGLVDPPVSFGPGTCAALAAGRAPGNSPKQEKDAGSEQGGI
jgi:hypothetical protein